MDQEGQSREDEFVFHSKYTPRGSEPVKYYVCLACRSRKEDENLTGAELPRLKITAEGRVFPMRQHAVHICRESSPEMLVAKHFERKRRLDIDAGHERRPREVYENMLADLSREMQHSSRQERLAVERHIQPYQCVRAAYYRRLNKRYPTLMGIGEPSDAWQQLSLTWEARHSSDMEDTMVLYQKTQPPTVVLASALDLEILHQSRHWVCDGTFQYCPSGFAQLYSIHGFLHGEAVPLVVALLPSRSAATYAELFNVTKDALTSRFGTVGALECGHFDFETGAIGRFEAVFRVQAKGCLFHFIQCITRKVGELGLQTLYRDEENPALKQWVRKVVGLALLPPELVLVHWNDCLKH
ncbi:uncharacterized protein LOC135375191 [Ornithodoros turicata]